MPLARREYVTVLAGGWSARAYLDRLPGLVIGVNDAALVYPADLAVSMDRLWTEHRWGELEARGPRRAWIRRSVLKNIPTRPDWLTPFECDHTSIALSEDPWTLNGTHSGLCAINLAYHLRPRRLVLVGFDMGPGPAGEAHFYPPYPWAPHGATTAGKFKAWAAQFGPAAAALARADVAVEVWGQTQIPVFKVRA